MNDFIDLIEWMIGIQNDLRVCFSYLYNIGWLVLTLHGLHYENTIMM